ncbi:MAG: hypothetical protein ACXWAT_00600 [Methylobacter sp.]
MASSDPPPAPDYVGAANAQGAANLEAAVASGHINNPTVYNPYGSQTVTWNGNDPTITQSLTPAQQQILNKGVQAKNAMLDTGNTLMGSVQANLSKGLDFSGLPNAPVSANQRRNDVINSMMSRVDTDTAGQRDAKNSELIAAGIRPGTAAYQTAMGQIDRQYNDARQQAILAGGQEATRDFGMDNQARQQAIAEMLTKRETPLNEVNAMTSGAQVNNPFASGLGYQAGANVSGAPIAGAINAQGQYAQNAYNANQAQMNGNISAGAGLIGSLGSAYIGK